MPTGSSRFLEFRNFRFDTETKTLWSEGDLVSISPKATEVLYLLIENRGNLVEREAIVNHVWPDTFVEDGNLNHAISALRRSLGDGVIQTVPRRGYRFTEPISEPVGSPDHLIIERQKLTTTVIEETEEVAGTDSSQSPLLPAHSNRRLFVIAASVILVLGVALAWYFAGDQRNNSSKGRKAISSIAVLPLGSFSSDASDEELRLRITDAVITKLGKIDSLVVRPTNSVLRFASERQDSEVAGKALGVDAVLDGRIQQENGRLRVTLQLLWVETGEQLWSEQFDGRVGEILALQDAISERFRRDLSFVEGRSGDTKQQVTNNESYEAYLKGRFLWNQRKRVSLFRALEYFEHAVEKDPNFALGYTGISDTYHLLQQRNEISTEDAFAKAEPAAQKALELEPQSAEAHVSMGSVSFVRYSNWVEAERFYRRAIDLKPNAPEAFARLGMLLNAWGRFDEAHTVLKKAEELDPTSVNNAIYLGANFYFSRQFDRAESQFRRILEFAPGTERAHFFLERIYEINGRYDDAVEHALKEREVFRPETIAPLREAFQAGGIRAFWRKQIELLISEAVNLRGQENHIASRYVLLGEFEKACEQVEINLRNHGTMKNYGRVDPLFEPLADNARFQELMKRYGPIR